MPNNYLLTGLPRCGKSTLLERVVAELPQKQGFLTKEVLRGDKRVGFSVVSNGNSICTLAHKDFKTDFEVSKYYVDVQGFEWALNESLFFQYTPEQVLYLEPIPVDTFRVFSIFEILAEMIVEATSPEGQSPYRSRCHNRRDFDLMMLNTLLG